MADEPSRSQREEKGISRKKIVGGAALMVGAAGLFMYIVGLKRRHRLDEEREIGSTPPQRKDGGTHAWTDATARHSVDDEPEREEA
jgi:hypothetical protein